jgi:O-antigen ligase
MLVSSLFFFYMADSFRSRRQRLWLLAALALGVLWSVVLGFLADWGLLSLDWLRPTWEHGYRTFRFQSVATNSGWYAMWLVLILPFLAGAAFFPGTGLGRGWRWMARAVFILGAAALFFTVARGGWLAGLLGCGLTSGLALRAWLRDKGFRRRGWMTAGACVLVLLILVGGLAIAAKHDRRIGIRLQTLLDASGRVDIWRVSLRLWRERPLLGVGLGNYYQSTLTLPPRESFKDGKAKGTAHNTYLHVLTERGPFALAALLTIVLVAAWRVGKRPSERRDAGRVDWWMASALGMFTAWLVYGTVQYMFVLRLHDLSFWALTALALGEAGLCGASRSGLVLAGKDIREEQRRKLLWADWRQRFGGAGGAKNALNWKIVARMTAWLASPMAVFLELSLALSPLLSKGATNASAFVEKFELERGGWFLFALAGFAPLALGVSLILDTWLRPGLRMGSALVHNLARYGLFAALFYGVAAVFYFQERGVPDFGSRSMALFFIGLVLTMNQGLLIGKFYRSRSPRLLSPKPDGVSVPLVARLRPYLMGLVFLAAAPVFYSWAATPFWIKALCLWNPILPGVRVSQILLMGEPVSLWPWMLLLVAWNSILPFVDAGERLKSIVKARRSLQRGMTA